MERFDWLTLIKKARKMDQSWSFSFPTISREAHAWDMAPGFLISRTVTAVSVSIRETINKSRTERKKSKSAALKKLEIINFYIGVLWRVFSHFFGGINFLSITLRCYYWLAMMFDTRFSSFKGNIIIYILQSWYWFYDKV